MSPIVCEICFDLFPTAEGYLTHKDIHYDAEPVYGIRAIFSAEGKPDTYTYYGEVRFETTGDALYAIEGNYGEELAELSTLDSRLESDLAGYIFQDLEPYLIEGGN